MSGPELQPIGRAEELRRAFDRSFRELPPHERAGSEDLISVQVARARFALRIRELSGLLVDKTIVYLPTTVDELLGIFNFRGVTIPVYDLAGLLGLGRGDTSRWLVIVRNGDPVAFAFDRYEGHESAAQADILPANPSDDGRDCVRDAVRIGEQLLPILDTTLVIEAVKYRCGPRSI